jgi:acyl-[acyl-carrier-protein]-phospholipid O-acyltransferase/long-chain-fatty-acid--[acyl-carrier-protein] ligase
LRPFVGFAYNQGPNPSNLIWRPPPPTGVVHPRSVSRVWALTVTAYQSACSEYALKTLVLLLLAGAFIPYLEREKSAVLVGAIFAVPFIIFSTPAGYLADRFSKRNVTIFTKLVELIITALLAFVIARNNLGLAIVAGLLLRCEAAIFGPSKYGLLPELLRESRLSWGNGFLQLAMFSAMVMGKHCLCGNGRPRPSGPCLARL